MRNEFEYDSYNAHKIKGHYKIFSKITVDIYPMIEINNFENMEDSEAIDKLTEELFYKIYQGKYGNLYSK